MSECAAADGARSSCGAASTTSLSAPSATSGVGAVVSTSILASAGAWARVTRLRAGRRAGCFTGVGSDVASGSLGAFCSVGEFCSGAATLAAGGTGAWAGGPAGRLALRRRARGALGASCAASFAGVSAFGAGATGVSCSVADVCVWGVCSAAEIRCGSVTCSASGYCSDIVLLIEVLGHFAKPARCTQR